MRKAAVYKPSKAMLVVYSIVLKYVKQEKRAEVRKQLAESFDAFARKPRRDLCTVILRNVQDVESQKRIVAELQSMPFWFERKLAGHLAYLIEENSKTEVDPDLEECDEKIGTAWEGLQSMMDEHMMEVKQRTGKPSDYEVLLNMFRRVAPHLVESDGTIVLNDDEHFPLSWSVDFEFTGDLELCEINLDADDLFNYDELAEDFEAYEAMPPEVREAYLVFAEWRYDQFQHEWRDRIIKDDDDRPTRAEVMRDP